MDITSCARTYSESRIIWVETPDSLPPSVLLSKASSSPLDVGSAPGESRVTYSGLTNYVDIALCKLKCLREAFSITKKRRAYWEPELRSSAASCGTALSVLLPNTILVWQS